MWHVWGRGGFWWGNLSGRDRLENVGVSRKVILKWITKNAFT